MARHHRLALGGVFGTIIGLIFVAALWGISQYITVEENQRYQLSHDLQLVRRGNNELRGQAWEIYWDSDDLYALAGGAVGPASHQRPSPDPSVEPHP